MDHPEAKYYKKYVFPLRNVTPELIIYLQELKETLHQNPWFAALTFRSLIEKDDREAACQEIEREYKVFADWAGYAFILLVKLKEPYHVKITSPNDIRLVRRGETLLEDPLLMMTDTIPHKAKAQWETLTHLVAVNNQEGR